MAAVALDDEQRDLRKLGDSERATEMCKALEAELAELKVSYEQYFLGVERLPPTKHHDELKKKMATLKGQFVRQTASKFRVQSIAQKFLSYEKLWERTLSEMEAGTYHRDLAKARRRAKKRDLAQAKNADSKNKSKSADPTFEIDEDIDLKEIDEIISESRASLPDVDDLDSALDRVFGESRVESRDLLSNALAAQPQRSSSMMKPGAPLPPKNTKAIVGNGTPIQAPRLRMPSCAPLSSSAARPIPQSDPNGGLSDTKIRSIYESFVAAKKQCGEDLSGTTLDSVATTLRKQVPTLLKQHNAKSVEFRVIIRDGKAVLRAVPKEH